MSLKSKENKPSASIFIPVYGVHTALEWYSWKLTKFEKESLSKISLDRGWITLLIEHFKERSAQAGIDVLASEGITLGLKNSHAYNRSCQESEFYFVTPPYHWLKRRSWGCHIKPTSRNRTYKKGRNRTRQIDRRRLRPSLEVKAKPHREIALPHSEAKIPVKIKSSLPDDRAFLFDPRHASTGLTVYSHAVNANMSFVTAVNRTNKPTNLAAYTRAGTLSDLDTVIAYQANPTAAELSAVALEKDSVSVHTTPNPSRATTVIDNGTKEVVEILKPAVYDIWRDKGAGVDIPMDRQAYPEKSYDASDKDLYSVQTPPGSLQDIHTENPTQEEASFNDEATESNSPTVNSEYPDEFKYACRQRNIAFPSSQLLLGQGIDSLKLSTLEPNLDAITVLEFPQTLKALGMTGLLRQYVNGYTWKAELLQEWKTLLLKNGPVKGPPRKYFAARMILDDESFHELQKASVKFLYHHDYGPGIQCEGKESTRRESAKVVTY
jgi:hypothetical protein